MVTEYFRCHLTWPITCVQSNPFDFRDCDASLASEPLRSAVHRARSYPLTATFSFFVHYPNSRPFSKRARLLLKTYLDEVYDGSAQDPHTAPDAGMRHLLEPVELLLRDNYTAVGILEQYNRTLHLFNASLEMPGVDWPSAFQDLGVKNKDRFFDKDIRQAVKKIMTDSKIKKFLQLDLLLYDHAVAVHNAQAAAYGLL